MVVFDIDGTVANYDTNHIKDYMAIIIKQFDNLKTVQIVFLTNRGSNEEKDNYKENINDKLHLIAPNCQIIYNDMLDYTEHKLFKDNWFKKQNNIISSFGDNLNDLHSGIVTCSENIKSRGWWLQIDYFKQQDEFD